MLASFWFWLVKVVGGAVLLGGLSAGCAAKGSVCLEWDMVMAEDVRQLGEGADEGD